MTTAERDYEAYAEAARALLARIEEGDHERIEESIESLTRMRERELFREVGQLTRELHDALKNFRVDSRLADLASSDIPDAQQRLEYVIEMTENSAHRTLTALEESLETLSGLGEEGRALRERWGRFRNRELSADEFRDLSRDLDAFLARLEEQGTTVQSQLTDALMAQDYQDLTGQIIRRVMTLVKEVEDSLVGMIAVSARGEEMEGAADKKDKRKQGELDGPQVPGQESGDAVSGQDEVDDLLSSLGF